MTGTWNSYNPYLNTGPLRDEIANRYGWRLTAGVIPCPTVVLNRNCHGFTGYRPARPSTPR